MAYFRVWTFVRRDAIDRKDTIIRAMELTALLILVYFAWLVVALRKRQRTVQGPWLFLLRAFFPNWQFFHGLGPAPRLWVRAQDKADQWSNWQLVDPRLPRQAWHLLHNPSVNLALSHQNLVEHLATDVHDLAENADIRDCVSYQLVTRLARDAVQGGCWADTPMVHRPDGFDPKAFQFEVRLLRLGQPGDAQLLLSPVMRLHP
jgi:hypothetical protein